VGGNRRSRTDAVDSEVPIIVVKDFTTNTIKALSTIYCMHPTILHEDSKLYSADFPGYTRKYLKKELGEDVILLYHTGPSGNQSPRHFIKSNTFDEAERLGFMLGEQITNSILKLDDSHYQDWVPLSVRQTGIMLPQKEFMDVKAAENKVILVKTKLEHMRLDGTPASEIRTVECDWFGAEENKQLCEMAESGKLEKVYQSVLPAEIDIIGIDDNHFVLLPGELFVEYSLRIKAESPGKIFIASLSNGVLAGYLVTEEAEEEGGYEASNSIFPAKGGQLVVKRVSEMLRNSDIKEES